MTGCASGRLAVVNGTRVDIRQLDEASASALTEAFSAAGWNKPRDQYAKYLDQQARGEIVCLVAHVDHAVAGYLKIVWAPGYPPLKEAGIPEIQDLNVLDPFRRRGVASRLLDRAESEVAKTSSVVGIGVGLHPGYNAAQRLYVLRGYVPDARGVTYKDRYVAEREVLPFDDDLVLHFTKDLREA